MKEIIESIDYKTWESQLNDIFSKYPSFNKDDCRVLIDIV